SQAGPSAGTRSPDDTYRFRPKNTPPLTSGGQPVTLDFSECAGVLRLHFVDGVGIAMPIQSISYFSGAAGLVDKFSQNVAYAYVGLPDQVSVSTYDIVVPGGGTYETLLTYGFGTNYYGDQPGYTVNFSTTLTNTVACDQILDVNVVVPNQSQLATIKGRVGIS